jgi:hypothetical protein
MTARVFGRRWRGMVATLALDRCVAARQRLPESSLDD